MTPARIALVLVLAATPFAVAQHAALTPGEARATRALDAAKNMGSGELYAFLKPFPKGADLHMHLSGAVYAETFITDAAHEGICVAPVDVDPPATPVGQDALRFVPHIQGHPNDCTPGQASASSALHDQPLYDDLVDSFSMRAFVPTQGINGHDQFFSTFDRFRALQSNLGEWLDEVATRAAAQNEQYLEIMHTPTFKNARSLGNLIGWPAGAAQTITPAELAHVRDQLLTAGLRDEVSTDTKEFADALAARNTREHCDATAAQPAACHITIHFLYQVLRGNPPQQVFAQTLLGFEVASADPADVVGINLVMPEDGYLSMRDYHLQMQMLDYLHSVYPTVRISLHAGELAPGLVPFEGLSFHIREAIDLGHAQRIGHGVDVLYEDNAAALLKQMAGQHIMVEINLTSNAGILNIQGKDHPLAAYRAAHVPWALSTDDEGVSRIDLTHEYARGVAEQNLTYVDLKRSARTSLEHAFLHGDSLYAAPDDFAHRRPVCAAVTAKPSTACQTFLHANEKAAAQYELERRLAAFELSVR